MSIVYFDQLLKVLDTSPAIRETFTCVAKQTGYAAAGTAIGGLLVGPIGALVGGVLGAVYGYGQSSDYSNLMESIRSLNNKEKRELSAQIQCLVGSSTIEGLTNFLASEYNRKKLVDLLTSFTSK
ncbi:hypothetical protein DICVIV_13505 [Dictyocaulus viviparus]|uniref:Glycine zipper domain-containing protein n=1 Tax=Dictyocaulus viviparus TaxID=29172 RepID=A0A0D8X7K6_DICVI|nr:hypothetical protein DICVIV_13505 [Dictyocaulus viviparus]